MSELPYAAALGGRDAEAVIAETPLRLKKVYDTLSREQLEARPAPDKWNLREVMVHMAECEVAWAWRLRYVLGDARPVTQPFDQDAWAVKKGAYTLEAARATFDALRAWNVAFVGAMSEAERQKMYTHPERGEEAAWALVEIMAGHDLHHLKVLEAL